MSFLWHTQLLHQEWLTPTWRLPDFCKQNLSTFEKNGPLPSVFMCNPANYEISPDNSKHHSQDHSFNRLLVTLKCSPGVSFLLLLFSNTFFVIKMTCSVNCVCDLLIQPMTSVIKKLFHECLNLVKEDRVAYRAGAISWPTSSLKCFWIWVPNFSLTHNNSRWTAEGVPRMKVTEQCWLLSSHLT